METIQIYWVRIPERVHAVEFTGRFEILDREERKRYDHYLVEGKKIEFLTGRLLLKELLAQILGVEAKNIHFEQNDYGKLFLNSCYTVKEGKPPLFFNLSHSGRIVTCALSSVEEICIDVECTTHNLLEIMSMVYVPKEIKFVESQRDFEAKLKAFYQIWTRKEAVMKAIGKGFSLSPVSFAVPFEKDRETDSDYEFYTFCPLQDHMISVAVRRENGVMFNYYVFEIEFLELFKGNISFAF